MRLLETRREIERLVCRSAAKRANENERKNFARLTAEFTEASLNNDAVAFMRSDREFNELCLVSARNEFAESALRSLNGLSRRFWYLHYQQSADLPEMARLHAGVAAAIAAGNPVDAAAASNLLIDNIESFTKATVMLDQI
ncbi:FCD domain protein [compost metagenome]